jgi:hypothetical protein
MNLRLGPPFFPRCCFAVALLTAVAATGTAQQPKKGTDKPITQVFPLKAANAKEVAVILNQVFREPRGDLIFAVDPSTNSVIVKGIPDHILEVAQLLRTLDAGAADRVGGGAAPRLSVFRLKYVDPELATGVLSLLFPSKGTDRFLVDRNQRLVILYCQPNMTDIASALLDRLDQTPALEPVLPFDYHLRIVWLRGTASDDKAAKPAPKEFEELQPDLAKLGIERPVVAGQMMTFIAKGLPFDIIGDSPLVGSRWMLSGQMSETGALDMIMTVEPSRDFKGKMAPLLNDAKAQALVFLRTHVKLQSPKWLLVGAAPTGTGMAAFAVQVSAKLTPGPAAKKVGALEGQSWTDVLAWLSAETGLPILGNVKPAGKANFLPPTKKLAAGEAIDLVNEALLTHKFLLIRGERGITLLAADEKVDPTLLRRVTLPELDKCFKTELVTLVLPVQFTTAEELAPVIRKMQGPFGAVVALPKANRLVLQDTAANLRTICQVVKDCEDKKSK